MAMIAMDPLPRFEKITLTLHDMVAVRAGRVLTRPVSAQWQSGAAILLRARNGVGKTTLLRQLAGISSHGGYDYRRGGQIALPGQLCAYLGHQNGLYPHDKVEAALSEQIRLCGVRDRATQAGLMEKAVQAFHLAPLMDAETSRLSAGQQRRVALARLWVTQRPVWLLDEPAAPLDGHARSWLDAAIAAHRARGGIVIAAVHSVPDWPEAQTCALEAAPLPEDAV